LIKTGLGGHWAHCGPAEQLVVSPGLQPRQSRLWTVIEVLTGTAG
jgi:hypothetical protein